MQFSRRNILLGAGAAGGLVIAWALTPRSFRPPLAPGPGEYAFDAWLTIGRDGVVTVAVPDLEMGQGVTTLLPQIVAMELGADWRQLAVAPAPISGAYANAPLAAHWAALWMPLMPGLAEAPDALLARRFAESEPLMATAEGTTLAAHELPARIAAASARAMLAKAAAARWGVSWEECEAKDGFILHDRKHLSFADLVEEAAAITPPDPPVLRPTPPAERPSEYPPGARLAFPRLDLPAKVDGSLSFAGDIRLPGMLFAAIRHGPIGDSRLGEFDPAPAKRVSGFRKLVKGDNWLAAVATDWWSAERALTLISPHFAVGARAESGRFYTRLERALQSGRASTIAEIGDSDQFSGVRFDHTVNYSLAPALHATLETASATARFKDGKLVLWLGCQAQQIARRAAARALRISAADVVIYPVAAGGSFDRRLEHEHAVEAALIARDLGHPVQLTWSRWQEHVAGLPRCPLRAVLSARTAQDGTPVALKMRIAMPATAQEFGARLFGGKDAITAADKAQDQADPMALAGAMPPYAIDNLLIEHVPVAIGLPTGRMRGNGDGYGCFLVETFIDELAQRSGREPMSFRMALLGHDVKLANCLQRAASLAEWNGGIGGSGQGLACHRMMLGKGAEAREGRIAVVATARRDERGIRVDKLCAVADIGRVVNADIARQQIEGGMIFGMGIAAGSTTAYGDGLPLVSRLGMLGLPLLADCPEIEVEFIEGNAAPFDPGELGAVAVVPAIANALYSAGGTRSHTLPLTAEES